MDERVGTREIVHGDALAWLTEAGVVTGASFVTSMPDVSELAPMTLPTWRGWFTSTAAAVLRATPDHGVAIFFQTDVIVDGVWVDKAHLVQRAADDLGVPLRFHRVSCRFRPGSPNHGRPGYSHLLGFSRGVTPRGDRPRTDVLPDGGRMVWPRAMGLDACVDACRWVRDHTTSTTIVDPFCGHGGLLAVAEAMGFRAVGVELSRKRAEAARRLALEPGEVERIRSR